MLDDLFKKSPKFGEINFGTAKKHQCQLSYEKSACKMLVKLTPVLREEEKRQKCCAFQFTFRSCCPVCPIDLNLSRMSIERAKSHD